MMPLFGSLSTYTRADLRADTVAGVVTAILLVPQAMAFAVLAGLPPQIGLYASFLPPIVYAFLGTSRTLAVGPVSVSAIMVASALGAYAGNTEAYLGTTLVLTLEIGLIFILLAALRLGELANFLSHSVLSGFTTAAALLIIVNQVPALLGVPGVSGNTTTYTGIAAILNQRDALVWATALVGVAAMLLLLAGGRSPPALLRRSGLNSQWADVFGRTIPLLAVIATTAAVMIFDLDRRYGVATVGAVPGGLPSIHFMPLQFHLWLELLPSALAISLISYVESISLAKVLADRRRQRVDANQELLALGAANLASAFSSAMPVAGGFSRTAVNFAAGARTQIAGIITGLLIGASLLAFTPLFARMPKATLAAIIIVAAAKLIDIRTVVGTWRYQRSDAVILLLTITGVLALGIERGLILGVGLSLLSGVWRMSRPHIAVVGRVPGTNHFRNVLRYRVETWPELLFIRVDADFNFMNMRRIEEFVMARLLRQPQARHLVLICSAVNHIDSSALLELERLVIGLRADGVTVHFAEVKGPVLEGLQRVPVMRQALPGRIYMQAADAIAELAGAGEPVSEAKK
jgi:SulP family sulfate permease